MMQFFANTGFLFPALPFADRLRAAALAGFDGVECHDEIQRHNASEIADILVQTGLDTGALNTRMGVTKGCAALRDQQTQFVQDIRAAATSAQAVGARAIHVLAGVGALDRAIFADNLRRALDLTDRMILIEPISPRAIPGYALNSLAEALEICAQVGDPRLRVMFDWFHMADTLGAAQAARALTNHCATIGHVQLASHPDRTEPDAALIARVASAGFSCIGLEYHPMQPEGHVLARLRAAYAP